MESSVTTRRKSWERITILGAFGVISEIQRANFGYLSPIFVEAKFGAPTRIPEANFGAKPPDFLIWKYPPGAITQSTSSLTARKPNHFYQNVQFFTKVHYPKLVELRKAFIPEIYEKFTPYPDVNSINDILHIILRGSSNMNYNRIGKFLSLVLMNTQDLLIEVERDKGSTSRN